MDNVIFIYFQFLEIPICVVLVKTIKNRIWDGVKFCILQLLTTQKIVQSINVIDIMSLKKVYCFPDTIHLGHLLPILSITMSFDGFTELENQDIRFAAKDHGHATRSFYICSN